MTDAPLRDRLVQAGVELLEDEGLGNLSLRAITRRTGVSHGAPRRYFATHNALLAAIALWTNIHGLATLRATNALELLGTTDLTPLVRQIVRIHLS